MKQELEAGIADMPDNYRTSRKKLREEYQPLISEANQKILDIKSEIGDLKASLVETGVDVGPAIYLARTFNTDIDTVVKFFIFVLIFVFDPMAVMFVISYNVILQDRGENKTRFGDKSSDPKNITKKRWWEVYGEKKEEEPIEIEPEPSGEVEVKKVPEKKPPLEKGAFSRSKYR